MTLTPAQIRCLIALLALSRLSEDVASKDVAKLLGVTRPSAHKALDILCREGLAEKIPYGAVHLTPEGRRLAELMERRRENLMLLFCRDYQLPLDESSLAAAQLMSELREDSLSLLETRGTGSPAAAGAQL